MNKSARSKQHDTLASAPGFNTDIVYDHSSRVKSCCWQGKWFISLDQQSLQIWGRDWMDPDKIEVHQKQSFPENRSHFVSAVAHAAPLTQANPIILAACLDHTLKIYSEKLKLRSSIKWDAGTVTMMVYNTKNDTIITAGSAGVKLWASTADTEAYAREKALPASDRPWLDPDGRIVPWCYGRFQTAKEQLAYQVPGLKTRITAADVAVPEAGNVSWCNLIQLLVPQQLLLVMFQADVYGFDAADGTRLYSWRGLSEQPLVDMVYLTGHQQLVTASREPTVMVRQLQQDGSLAWVRSLGRFAAGVHCVAAALGRPWLLTASLDGFVVVWSTENWQQLFRMKLPEAISGIQFFKTDHLFCLSGNQVKFFKLRQAAESWMELSSPLTSLEPLSYGLLLATFADSSIRLLDAGSSAADKSALTTVPQLSSASLLAAAADLPGGRLFALLSGGHVHVWDLHLTRPPALSEVWTHLQQEKCCSMAFMDGASMDPVIAKALGLSIKGQSTASTVGRPASATAAAAAADGADPLEQHQRRQQQLDDGVSTEHQQQQQDRYAGSSDEAAAEPVVEDHVFVGTKKGEVLVCDASRQGLLVLRIPAIKLLPASLLLLDLDFNRMVVAGGNVVRVWDLTKLVCIAEFEAKSELLSGHILEGRLLLGSASGRCYMLDLVTGKPVAPPASAAAATAAGSSDHDGPVTCVSGSVYLQHYLTASQDGYVKVYDRDRRLKASLYLAAPLAAAAFLNDQGDILVAPIGGKHLMVVRAATYAVTPRTRRNDTEVSIFDDLKGRGAATPRTLMRNMTCSLQALATTPGPVPVARYPAALPVGSVPASPTTAKTPGARASIPPWGLPSPSGLKPEVSLQQPEVIQSSTRPPVDLEQNRVRAETARVMGPARSPDRQSTIGRAVQQQQQQQHAGGPDDQADGSSDWPSAAAAAVSVHLGGGSRLSRMARGSNAQPSLQRQQQQQQLQTHMAAAEQQQQQPSLPQLKQLPAVFAGLSVSTNDAAQQQQQQRSVTTSFPPISTIGGFGGLHATGAAAGAAANTTAAISQSGLAVIITSNRAADTADRAAAAGDAGLHSDGLRKLSAAGLTGSGSTGSGSRWNTTTEYDLKALESPKHRKGHRAAAAAEGSSDNSSSSDAMSGSSDESDGSDSEGYNEADFAADYAAAVAAANTTAAAAAGVADATAELFRVGQLNIKLPNGYTAAGYLGQQQQPSAAAGQHRSSSPAGRALPGASIAARPGSNQDSNQGSTSSSSRHLEGLQGAMKRTVAVVESPDVFLEGVPVPDDLQLVLNRYHAETAAVAGKKGKKGKKKAKKVRKQGVEGGTRQDAAVTGGLADAVIAAGAYGGWRGAHGSVDDPAAAAAAKPAAAAAAAAQKPKKKTATQKAAAEGASSSKKAISSGSTGSSPSKPKKSVKSSKKLSYTSALDYLMHTVSDPVVLTELKEAESHDSRQAALAKQWLAVGSSSRTHRADAEKGSPSKKGIPVISSSGAVQKLLESMTANIAEQQQQRQEQPGVLDVNGLLDLGATVPQEGASTRMSGTGSQSRQ